MPILPILSLRLGVFARKFSGFGSTQKLKIKSKP
jgi:hypothetical protein